MCVLLLGGPGALGAAHEEGLLDDALGLSQDWAYDVNEQIIR